MLEQVDKRNGTSMKGYFTVDVYHLTQMKETYDVSFCAPSMRDVIKQVNKFVDCCKAIVYDEDGKHLLTIDMLKRPDRVRDKSLAKSMDEW